MNYNTSEIRVRFSETDPAGIAHFGVYANYIDVGRNEFYRQFRGKVRRPGDDNVSTVLVETNYQYKNPGRFDDLLVVYTTLAFVKNTSFGFKFKIKNKTTDKLVCLASANHVCLSIENYKPTNVPDWLVELYEKIKEDEIFETL